MAQEAGRQVMALQERRVGTYREFEVGLKEFVESFRGSEDESRYVVKAQEVKRVFGQVSEAVREVETRLRESLGRPDLADLVRGVQNNEREKLRLTVLRHSLLCCSSDDTEGQDDEDDEEEPRETVEGIEEKIRVTVDRINGLLEDLRAEIC